MSNKTVCWFIFGLMLFGASVCDAATQETIKKETTPKKRNLVNNPSAEIAKSNIPVGWGLYKNSGIFEWGVTDKEKHSGKYSVYLKAKEYKSKPNKNGVKCFSAAILAAKSNGRSSSDCIVEPNTVYTFSFWMKAKSPSVSIYCLAFGKTAGYLATDLRWICPQDDQWHQYQGKFVTKEDTKTIVLAIGLIGCERKTRRCHFIPLGAAIYIDDVVIHKKESEASLTKMRK